MFLQDFPTVCCSSYRFLAATVVLSPIANICGIVIPFEQKKHLKLSFFKQGKDIEEVVTESAAA